MQGAGRLSHLRAILSRPDRVWTIPLACALLAATALVRDGVPADSPLRPWLAAISLGWSPLGWLALFALGLATVLFEGSYRDHRALALKLGAVSRERPLAFMDCDFAVDVAAIRQRQVLRLTGWSLTFKNLGRRLLRFEVEEAWLKAGDRIGHHTPGAAVDANASPLVEVTHRVEFEEPLEIGPVPASFVVGFTVHYDNVPAVGRRTLIREIRYDVSALLPITSRSVVLRREEL